MAKIKKFEELQSWKKNRKLTNEIYESTRTGSLLKTMVFETKCEEPQFRFSLT